jgi:hypothetical protein
MNMDTTVAVLDAQIIAVQAKITSKQDAPIEYILPIFKITPFHVGNAGNAATYITIIAFLSVLRDQLYGAESNPRAKPGQTGISAIEVRQQRHAMADGTANSTATIWSYDVLLQV